MSTETDLWREVLTIAAQDALTGSREHINKAGQKLETIRIRKWFTEPNEDFEMVCTMADVNPIAVREAMIKRIADAPTPDQLFEHGRKRRNARKPNCHQRGVVSDFASGKGTGGGTAAQETPKITFQDALI